MASLIFRPDLRFFALTSFQSVNRPSLSLGSSSRISRSRHSFSVSLARRRPPGNIHSRSRLLLTNKTRPRLAATSLDDFAISGPSRSRTNRRREFYSVAQSKATAHRTRQNRGLHNLSPLVVRQYTQSNGPQCACRGPLRLALDQHLPAPWTPT